MIIKKKSKNNRNSTNSNKYSFFDKKKLTQMNYDIINELSSPNFKPPNCFKRAKIKSKKKNLKKIILELSNKSTKIGGFLDEESEYESQFSSHENDSEGMETDSSMMYNDEIEGTSLMQLKEMSEINQENLTKKGKLTQAVESIISSKFPFYIRVMTVLIKIFICIMFSTLNLRQLGKEYFLKYILGILLRYPDVCAVLTGNFLSQIKSLSKQLFNFPVISQIIGFINSISGNSLQVGNIYLNKIINFFEKNLSKITSYGTFFDFMSTIINDYSDMNLKDPNTWLKIQSDPRVLSKIGGALLGVITRLICPEDIYSLDKKGDIRQTACPYIDYMIRIPCFLISLKSISKDFIISIAPLYSYYVIGSSTMASNLCTSVCASLYNTGDAIIGAKDDCLSAKQQRLKDDMKVAYSQDKSAQQMRVAKFGDMYNQGDLKESKIMIDRMIDNESFQKLNLFVINPSSKIINSGINMSIQNTIGGFFTVPKTVYWVANKGSWLVDKALQKTGLKAMPTKEIVYKDEDGNIVKEAVTKYGETVNPSNVDERDKLEITSLDKGFDILKNKTVGAEGLDISGKLESIPENINRNLRKHHQNVLNDLYSKDSELKDYDYLKKERLQDENMITQEELDKMEENAQSRLLNKSSLEELNSQTWKDLENTYGNTKRILHQRH